MTKDQKALLEPFGEQFHKWASTIDKLTEFAALEAACAAASPTNCPWPIFNAARALQAIIHAEQETALLSREARPPRSKAA